MRKKPGAVPRIPDIEAVVFDLDGVLVDSEPIHFRAANRVLARYGVSISEEDYCSFIGLGEAATWSQWCERYGLVEPVPMWLVEEARVEEIGAGVSAIEAAVQLARQLHESGRRLAIASSSTPRVIDALVTRLGLDEVFGVRVSGEDAAVRHSKPAPDVYLEAAARLGIAPAACLAIEDSSPGVAAATQAGMTCIAVPNRWTAQQDFRAADVILESLRYFPLLVL